MTFSYWRPLLRLGAACALSVVALMVVQMVVFMVWPFPSEGTPLQWFAIFEQSWMRGLLSMDLLLLVDYLLLVPVYLALFVVLRRTSPAWMLLATTLFLLAAAAFFSSNSCFEMLSLSAKYSAAVTETDKATFVAAGQVMLERWEGTAFDVSYVLGAVGVLIVSAVMLRSTAFAKATAYAGFAMGATSLIPASAGSLGLTMSLLSLIPTAAWLVLVWRDLLSLSSDWGR